MIERTYYCEGPECEAHAATATPPPHLPMGFIAVRQRHNLGEREQHFCCWDCLLKFAARFPPPERIELHDA